MLTTGNCARARSAQVPYPADTLAPALSAQTLTAHQKLYKAYADNLQKTEEAASEAGYTAQLARDLAFYGAGYLLHRVYFANMTAKAQSGAPGPETAALFDGAFGGLAGFKKQFSEVGKGIRGSGWALLCYRPASECFGVFAADRHENFSEWGAVPVLALDVWEHAYYLDYPADRAAYIENWWSIVNWRDVERRVADAQRGIRR